MLVKEVFEKTTQFFKDKKIETARLDAEILISAALNTTRMQIYLKYDQPLKENEIVKCREFVKRRSEGEPVAYIVGEKGFYGEIFKVGKGVLIPRPETETLVEKAVEYVGYSKIEKPKILDIGAGTGCIGLSIIKHIAEAELVSVEKTEEAFFYLSENQKNLKLENRSTLVCADFKNFSTPDKFDLIVANPPYIAPDDNLVETNVAKFEPHTALYSENGGNADIKTWSKRAIQFLKPKGAMLFEIGFRQGDEIKKHFEELSSFKDIKVIKDLSGLDRIVMGER